MKIRIWPYKNGSAGAKEIQRALQGEGINCLRIMQGGNYRRQYNNHLIINWGNHGNVPFIRANNTSLFLNKPESVYTAHDKLLTLEKLTQHNVNVPEFTEDIEYAKLLARDGHIVYCRKSTTSYGGRFIEIAQQPEEVVSAPLYTKGINVRREYRVHVFKNQVIDIVRKSRRLGEDGNPQDVNMLIRNHTNGWIFCREFDFTTDNKELIEQEAIKAIIALDLDFGAVDIVTEKRTGIPFILEVNTAPGNEGTTTQKYKEAIKNYINVL